MGEIDFATGLTFYLILVSSIALHEFGHAYSADKLGDMTPRSQGRVTLNPLAHLDPIGTGLIPLIMIFGLTGGLAIIGWGRPVMIDIRSFPPKQRVRNELIVTAAGPFMNLLIALGAAILGGLLYNVNDRLTELCMIIISINSALIVFNLMPIPPLDGSHFMRYALGMSDEAYMRWSMYGGIILLVLINVPAFRHIMGFFIELVSLPFVWLLVLMAGLVS